MDKLLIKIFKRGVSKKTTWLGRGVSQKSMLGPQGGRGGQKVLKIGPHGLWNYEWHLRIVYGAFLVALKLFSLSIMAQKPPPSC